MHPAYSIILFTSLTGIGYGLAGVIGLGLVPAESVAPGYGAALVLIIVGLLCSTAHLGHPERAWRAFSQWRSSWLSREGVASIITFVPLGIAFYLALQGGTPGQPIGYAIAALSVITVFCTSMIYASLRPVAQWRSVLTPLVFLAFAISGGLLAACAVAGLTAADVNRQLVGISLLALAGSWALKSIWWFRADRVRSKSTPETATGLAGRQSVQLLERPHVSDNYLTREMGYRVARRHARKLRPLAVILAAIAPGTALILVMAWPSWPISAMLTAGGLGAHLLGMLIERWLFFAQARHTVTLYYGAQTA